jgi:2-amino-4-hydroxy-6-hydroxymethyldihydropteridine diphosphokinase
VIALGSNIGDRLLNLQSAVKRLGEVIDLQQASAVYETVPMYLVDQPPFLNAAVLGKTTESPMTLLRDLKRIENEIGRQSRVVNGPREVDLDLIAYDQLSYTYRIDDKVILQIPHPKLGERRFVLAPMADIAEKLIIPRLGPVLDLLEKTNHQADSVVRIKDAVLHI